MRLLLVEEGIRALEYWQRLHWSTGPETFSHVLSFTFLYRNNVDRYHPSTLNIRPGVSHMQSFVPTYLSCDGVVIVAPISSGR